MDLAGFEHPPASSPQLTDAVRVTVKADIFSRDVAVSHETPGDTLIEIAEAGGLRPRRGFQTNIYLDGVPIPLEEWASVRPRGGADVVAVQIPQFGGDSSSTARLAATLAIVVASAAVAGPLGGTIATSLGFTSTAAASVATALVGTSLTIGGTLAVSALIPPPGTEGDQGDLFDDSTVTSQSNVIQPYGIIPAIKGNIVVFPKHLARPYTEIAGNDLIIRILLTPGVGPLDISEIKIGDTPIESISGVEFETRQGTGSEPDLTLFTRDVFEDPFVGSNPPEIRFDTGAQLFTTQPNTTEVTLDVTFPNGVFERRKDGKRDPFTVVTRYEIDINSTGTFEPFFEGGANIDTITRETSRIVRRTYRRANLSAGTHIVRVTRLTGDNFSDSNNVSAQFLTAFRSIQPTDVWPERDIAVIAIRARIDGPVERISCRAESLVEDFNGSIWVPLQKTSNPASLARSVLKDNANPTPILSDAELRDDLFEAWHGTAETEGWAFNGVFENQNGTVLDALRLIGIAGRARPTLPDGKYGFVQDVLQTVPKALITEHNSSGLTITKPWNPPPLALRVQFRNQDKGFERDERLVFDDGQTEINTPPNRIELLDLINSGITDSDLAWRHGRFYIANAKLRPEVFSTVQGLDALVVEVGDYVELQHNVILGRIGSGRINALTVDGGSNVVDITVNNAFEMEIGESYAVTIRSLIGGNTQINTFPVDTVVGTQDTLTFTTPVPPANAPSVGDLLAFGVSGVVTQDALVTDIIGQENLAAQILMTQLAPGVYTADQGPIPPFDSKIVLPRNFFALPPAVPIIESIKVEEISLQTVPDVVHQVQIEVTLRGPNSELPAPIQHELRLRELGDDDWPVQESYPGNVRVLLVAPQTVGRTLEIEVRAVGLATPGRTNASAWSPTSTINVPFPETTTTDVFIVSGLELLGQGLNAQFEGRNPTFVWRLTSNRGSTRFGEFGSEISFSEPGLAFFKVQVLDPSDNSLRREEIVATPTYTYDYDKNVSDSADNVALDDFILRVAVVDNFAREAPFQAIRVTNDPPAVPGGLQVNAGFSAITVQASFPLDPDFEGMIVWASETSSFAPGPSTEVIRGKQNILTFNATPGVTLFLRVAFFDAFSSDLARLNISSELSVTPITASASVPEFVFDQVVITPNDPGQDQVSWTSGTVDVSFEGTKQTVSIVAGTATYPGTGILYLYYALGGTTLIATSDRDTALGPNSQVVATYRGDINLSQGLGDVFQDGGLLIANTVLGTAIQANGITARELAVETIIVDTIQIGTAIVDTLQLRNAAVNSIIDDFATVPIVQTVVGDYVTVLSETIDTQGFVGSVTFNIEFVANVTAVSNPRIDCRAQLRRDGVPIQDWGFGSAEAQDGPARSAEVLHVLYKDDQASAGPHLYEVRTKIDAASGQSFGLTINKRALELRVTKR